MGHGGARPGSGRKKGSQNKNISAVRERTREIAERAIAEHLTPLEVMLMAMREAVEASDMAKAASFAKDAAPYLHPRLAAVEHAGPNDGPIQFQQIVRKIVKPDDPNA